MLKFELVHGSLMLHVPQYHPAVSKDEGVISIRFGETQEEALEALAGLEELIASLPETKTQLLAAAKAAVEDAEAGRIAAETKRSAREEEQRLMRASMELGVVPNVRPVGEAPKPVGGNRK